MPSAPNSLASVFAIPVTPARKEFDSISPSIGCFTDIEVIVMNRPQWRRCMRGSTSRAKYTALNKVRFAAARHSSSVVSRNFLDGGPPAFVTQMSIRPNFCSTASTKSRTASSLVTSKARQKTSRPDAAPISLAVRSRSAAVRAQIAISQPSFANSSAAARPFSPRSMNSALCRAAAQVRVVFANPIFPARREEIYVHGIFQSLCFVRHIRGNQNDFARADDRFPAIVEIEFQRARKDHRKLLAAVRMSRHDPSSRDKNPRQRRILAVQHLARDVRAQVFLFNLFKRSRCRHRAPLQDRRIASKNRPSKPPNRQCLASTPPGSTLCLFLPWLIYWLVAIRNYCRAASLRLICPRDAPRLARGDRPFRAIADPAVLVRHAPTN